MRIQHNIMAMNAYRNYTNNVAAMKSNLEKLSSGYKINRAGDDAAGLAISEKMRAQITGLQTAQKNAKDGISLVQTAEGSLTEVHDMLNRMVELASMSANGTYDNETDRNQLQKEMNQLRSEIDRIADSANFNGIKLLDGSLSESGIASVESKFELPAVGLELGKDTVLHRDEDENAASTAFGLELHNVKFTGKAGDKFTIDIGGTKMVGTLAKDMDGSDLNNTLKGEDMVAGLLGDTTKVTFADENGTAIDPAKITIGGKEYNMSAGVTKPSGPTEGTGILFKLNDPETNVEVSMDVKVYAGTDPNAAADAGESTTGAITGTANTSAVVIPAVGGVTGTGKTNASATVNEIKSSGIVLKGQFDGLALKDGIDTNGTAATEAIGAIAAGAAKASTESGKTTAEYAFSFDKAAINAALKDLADGATTISDGALKLVYTGGANNIVELQDSAGTTIGSVDFSSTPSAGTFTITDGTNNLGTITVTDKTTFDPTTDWSADDVMVADTGLSISTIKGDSLTTAAQKEAFTKAAVAAGAGTGVIEIAFNATADAGKRVELKVGGTVIGTADENQLNKTSTLSFKSADGVDIASIALAGNGELTGADLNGLTMDTGMTYTDARVNVASVGTVDHDALAAAVKELVTDQGKDIGDGELDVTLDNNGVMQLKLGDTVIATGALNGSKIEFTGSDTANDLLFDITLNNAPTALTNLAGDAATIFEGIGPKVSASDVTKNATDTTNLASDANLSDVINEVAKTEGVTIPDGTQLTISYNENGTTGEKFELKAGDLVVATGDERTTLAGDTLSLTFTGADGASTSLGNVDIKGLKADFKPADLKGDIATGITFDANATPATTASFVLDNDKLKEFAEANGVTAGQNVVVKYDGSDFALYFSDGTTDTKIEDGTLSADGKTVAFGDYGSASFSAAFDNTTSTTALDPIDTGLSYGETSFKSGLKGDFLVTTSDQQNTEQTAGDRLASTVLTLKDSMITDGASIFVAGKNYTFSTNKDTVMPEGAVKVDISDLDPKKDNYMSSVVKRLTDAYAADNTGVYTLGWNGKNVTVTETVTHANLKSDGSNDDTYADDGWDLRTMDGIAKSLGYSSAATKGKALTLQIGDTADKFNQMDISVNDMHTYAMGAKDGDTIADVDISTQEGAAKAVDTIKSAINYVSDVRGTLGATQNRLDHTINNLSVMTENIQDAESTIRDTDVAEEMMEYTKNNILIQSAQAMLAQANQMPQGVLQLLQ